MTSRRALLVGLVAGLGACAPLDLYYRPGATLAAVQRDTTACEVAALRQVPQSIQIRRTPPQYVPARRQCDGAGNCSTHPGYYLPGETYTFDANARLRTRVEELCMADKGYAPVSIPPCPEAVKRAAPARATRVLPALSQNSCVIRNRDGSFQIVTRG